MDKTYNVLEKMLVSGIYSFPHNVSKNLIQPFVQPLSFKMAQNKTFNPVVKPPVMLFQS